MSWISCINLKKTYFTGNKEIHAVKDISFEVDKDEIVGVLGPNGAGKTTIIKCICNLVNPTSGEIFIKGVRIGSCGSSPFEHIAAVLEGNRNIFWRLTVRENLEFFAGLQGYSFQEVKKEFNELMEVFHLTDKADTEARLLSRGMQQKLAIICAIIKGTDILFFDEPTLGLDVEMVQELKRLFREEKFFSGRAVLISSHNMNFIEDVCDRVLIISNGHLIADRQVSELKEFFKVKEYELVVANIQGGELPAILKEKFPVLKFQKNPESKTVKILIDFSEDSDQLSSAIKMVVDSGFKLLDIHSRQPNFEEIYLKLIKNQ